MNILKLHYVEIRNSSDLVPIPFLTLIQQYNRKCKSWVSVTIRLMKCNVTRYNIQNTSSQQQQCAQASHTTQNSNSMPSYRYLNRTPGCKLQLAKLLLKWATILTQPNINQAQQQIEFSMQANVTYY